MTDAVCPLPVDVTAAAFKKARDERDLSNAPLAREVCDFLSYRIGNFEYDNEVENVLWTLAALEDLGFTLARGPQRVPTWPKAWDQPLPRNFTSIDV